MSATDPGFTDTSPMPLDLLPDPLPPSLVIPEAVHINIDRYGIAYSRWTRAQAGGDKARNQVADEALTRARRALNESIQALMR